MKSKSITFLSFLPIYHLFILFCKQIFIEQEDFDFLNFEAIMMSIHQKQNQSKLHQYSFLKFIKLLMKVDSKFQLAPQLLLRIF